MNNELREKARALAMGHCNIFGNIVHGDRSNIQIIALAKDAQYPDELDALFYETNGYGEKKYGVGRNVILYENKVCWNGGSANWLSMTEGYRHFQYHIDHKEPCLAWHSIEWNALLDEVTPYLFVSAFQVSSFLNSAHNDYIETERPDIDLDSFVSVQSFDFLLSYALLKIMAYVFDGGLTLDNACYTYSIKEMQDDLKAALKRAEEL